MAISDLYKNIFAGTELDIMLEITCLRTRSMDWRSLEVSPTSTWVFAYILRITQQFSIVYLPSHAAEVAVMFPALSPC